MPDKASPDMRDKTRITVHMTQQFAKDLNLIMASYGISNVSFVVQQSVAAQANAIRERMATSGKHEEDK